MDKIVLEIKRGENTINDSAEKLELKSNTIMITNEELLPKFVVKEVKKTKSSLLLVKRSFNIRKNWISQIKYSKAMKIISVILKSKMID